ncbi:MAG: hypothetical protein ACMUIA_08605 [bacterium]
MDELMMAGIGYKRPMRTMSKEVMDEIMANDDHLIPDLKSFRGIGKSFLGR